MCGHGVPNATRLQLGDTHLQLAGTHPGYTIDNHLVDNAVVRLLHLTSLDVVGLLQSHLLGGQAMAQAFVAALTPSKPTYSPPEIHLSKDAQRIRDIQNNLSSIPTFGVEDDRPQTDGELKAKLHPQFITEPLLNNDNCKIVKGTNGEDVVGFDFQEIPVNGMPDFRM